MKKSDITVVSVAVAAFLIMTTGAMSEPRPAKEESRGNESTSHVKEVAEATVSLNVPGEAAPLTVTLAVKNEKLIRDLVTTPVANAKANEGPLTPSILFGHITLKMKDGSEEKCVLLCPWGHFDADNGLHLPSGRHLEPGSYIADLSGLGKLLVNGLRVALNGVTTPAPAAPVRKVIQGVPSQLNRKKVKKWSR